MVIGQAYYSPMILNVEHLEEIYSNLGETKSIGYHTSVRAYKTKLYRQIIRELYRDIVKLRGY